MPVSARVTESSRHAYHHEKTWNTILAELAELPVKSCLYNCVHVSVLTRVAQVIPELYGSGQVQMVYELKCGDIS